MATPPRIGSLKIEVDGRWDLADLQKFSESSLEAYGFLYHVLEDENSSLRLRDSKFAFELDDDFDFFLWGRLFYHRCCACRSGRAADTAAMWVVSQFEFSVI